MTWVGTKCRPLRDQQDSVSTDGQHQRFASPFHRSRQLDKERCQNLPETGVLENTSSVSKRAGQSHAIHPIPRPILFHPSTSVHPSTSNEVSEYDFHLPHAVCEFLSLGLIVLKSSAMAKPKKNRRAAAGLLTMLLQHNGRPVVKARGCGVCVRCYTGALCEECTRACL